ncbi:hypothetical protein L1987_34962 [Smallanthus sonchifolius]|uniref:Uncharacterized protein n=1 Tax=Smallanthus sonchifolius TaxID=185202 RepID=A0ACB9HW44_9ASTR|nr:hypothetical protein L1987_34962 [Smallanthus sonchifolius]
MYSVGTIVLSDCVDCSFSGFSSLWERLCSLIVLSSLLIVVYLIMLSVCAFFSEGTNQDGDVCSPKVSGSGFSMVAFGLLLPSYDALLKLRVYDGHLRLHC